MNYICNFNKFYVGSGWPSNMVPPPPSPKLQTGYETTGKVISTIWTIKPKSFAHDTKLLIHTCFSCKLELYKEFALNLPFKGYITNSPCNSQLTIDARHTTPILNLTASCFHPISFIISVRMMITGQFLYCKMSETMGRSQFVLFTIPHRNRTVMLFLSI